MNMISPQKIQQILANKTPELTEELAQRAAKLTEQYFGRTISLYTPLYISNYCSSHCTYCGFGIHNRIKRMKLSEEQIHSEMHKISQSGIENILLLTGESYKATPLSYLKKTVSIAKQYFTSIGLESFPMETEEYRELCLEGLDSVTIYQETYDRKRYKEVHLSGKKRDYDYRFHTPERIALAGIRQISLGFLLGLGNTAEDLASLYGHLAWMEKHFSGVEYSLSFPRMRKIKGVCTEGSAVDDVSFVKIICLSRITFPRIGINLSTRENPWLRDHALGLGVTRISAGSNTSVGGYTLVNPGEQNPQFDIEDTRTTPDIIKLLKKKDFDPVLTDWRRI